MSSMSKSSLLGPMVRVRINGDDSPAAGCAAMAFFVVAIGWFYGAMFSYVLWSSFARDIPWYADWVAGGIVGSFAGKLLFLAVVACWVVRLCGVPVPFFGH